MDDLRVAPLLVPPMRRAVASFVERALRDGDEVTLTTSSDDVNWRGRIPEARTDLLQALGLGGEGALGRATRFATRAVSLEERVGATGGAVDLADVTGGFSVRDNGVVKGLDRAAAESRVFYLLGFQSPGGKPASAWRDLRVEVERPGLEVRARKGYRLRATASTPASPTTDTATPEPNEG